MNILGPARRVRHLGRYREIVQILARHGYWAVIDQLGLTHLVTWPARMRRREPPPPPGTLAERVRAAIEELGPTFIKLGQVLSTRPDLVPPDFLLELSKLQDAVPPARWDAVRGVLEQEYAHPLESVFASFDPVPLAAASLAQVHAATLADGTEVVVKVQRPGILRTIDVDLDILFDLARLAQERTSLGEVYDFTAVAEDFAFVLRSELDYLVEGRNADRLRQNLAGLDIAYVPRVYWEYTTPRVLVLERIRGVKIDDLEGIRAAGLDPRQIVLNAAEMMIKEVLIDGFFHADPHPGNFYVLDGNVIGMMDFGIVGYLSQQVKEDLVRLFVVSVVMDVDGIVEQLIRMGGAEATVDRLRLRRDIERVLVRYHGLPLKQVRARDVIRDLLPIVYRHHLHLRTDLWLLGKTLMMWEGVALKLYPDFDVFSTADPYVRRFAREMRGPRATARRLAYALNQWSEILIDMPQQLRPLLMQVTQGQWQVRTRQESDERYLAHLDRITNRLALTILLAALIIGAGAIIPTVDLTWPWPTTTWLVMPGFLGLFFVGLWWFWSILRSGRR